MNDGVFPQAVTPCPAGTPGRYYSVRRGLQAARQLLCILTFLLALHLPAPSVYAASTTAPDSTQVSSQPNAAWSCRGVYHVVRRGETIYSIARRYGTTAYRIAVCNGLSSYTVYVGQTLLVPTSR